MEVIVITAPITFKHIAAIQKMLSVISNKVDE